MMIYKKKPYYLFWVHFFSGTTHIPPNFLLDTVALSWEDAHEQAVELAKMFKPEADVGVEVMEFKTYGPPPELQIWVGSEGEKMWDCADPVNAIKNWIYFSDDEKEEGFRYGQGTQCDCKKHI
jgi:hypothetical protein